MGGKQPDFLREMWQCLGEDPAPLQRVPHGGYPLLPSVFDTAGLVRDAVAAASLAASMLADLIAPRADAEARTIALDSDRITTAVTSASHFRLDGAAPDVWAEFSGFWPARDGWVRTHSNYSHHQARLLEALDLHPDVDRPTFEQRIAKLPALEIERRAAESGGVAVAVRNLHEWASHPQAVAISTEPLIRLSSLAPAPQREWPDSRAAAPLAGIRVLDLTRVIAGPTATQILALLGADVLRIDSPRLPEIAWQHLDTGSGKRSTLLDLAATADRCTFEDLLAGADVVVTGYRPDGLAKFGLNQLSAGVRGPANRHVGRVVARLSAWGPTGPWADRRGFDSIVQAASGIGWAQTADGNRPGVLPAQALDYSAGFLLAAGIVSALRRQTLDGGSWLLETSLAGIAGFLVRSSGGERTAGDVDSQPTTRDYQGPAGVITGARPAVQYQDGPDDWPAPARPWGGDQAQWAE